MIWHITHVNCEQLTIPEVDGTDRELGEGRPAMHKLAERMSDKFRACIGLLAN
jgi:hypothetical protein